MAVSKDDLLIKIQADTANATVNIEKLTSSVGILGLQILEANAAVELALHAFDGLKIVVEKLTEPFKEAIHASIEYNDKLLKLTNTLKITGSYSAASLDSFQEFAREMEINSGLSEELTFGMLSLAKSIGLGDGASVKLIKTAKNLSAVTGNDVNDSMNKLLASLKGNIREISTLDPTLKNLSTSALMSGAAVEQLAKKFDGFSEAATKSYKGIIAQSENFKEEIYRNIGDVLARAFDIKGIAEFKRDMYANVLETIERIKPSLMAFADGLADIKGRFTGGVIEKAKEFGAAIVGVYRAISVLDFQTLAIGVTVLSVAFGTLFVTIKAEAITTLIISLQTLIPVIKTMAAAAWAAVVPVALLAAKFVALSAIIIGVMAVVDFLVKNGLNILVGSLNWVISKVELAIGKFMQFIGLVKEGGKMIGLAWKTDNKAAQSFSEIGMGDTTKAALDKIQEMRDAYNQTTQAGEQGDNETLPGDGFKQIIDQAAKEAYLKALNEIKQRTDQINFDAEKAGMTQLEQLQRVYEMNQKILDQKSEEISLSKDFNGEQKKNLLAALNNEKDANTRKFNSNASQAPGQEYESAIIAGKKMTSDLTKAFQSGTAGMVTGFLSAADSFVSFMQTIVDFLPQFLDKIANLFNSVVELPMKIVASLDKVFSSILNYITNLIPNWLKAIPQIMKMVVKFLVEGIPKAFNALFDAIPQLIIELIDAIPDFVAGLVQYYIQSIPMIVIAFVEKIIPKLPRIAIEIARVMAIELPKAIVRGVVNGLREVFKALGGMFKGPKIFDTKDIKKQFDDVKKLTGSASDLFGIKDLANNAAEEARNQATQLGDAIKNATDGALERLINAWRDIYNKYIAPIGDVFKRAWEWLSDTITGGFKEAVSFISDVFNDVINPIFNVFLNTFNFLIDKLQPISNAFKWVADKLQAIFEPFIAAVEKLSKLNPLGGGGGGGNGNVLTNGTLDPTQWSSGGLVYASTGVLMKPRGTDTIPAMLAPGEFVMSSGAVKNLGVDAMRNINAGKSPGSSVVNNNAFTINIEAKGNIDESFVRQRLMPAIKAELKRSSLDGERTISSRGVR